MLPGPNLRHGISPDRRRRATLTGLDRRGAQIASIGIKRQGKGHIIHMNHALFGLRHPGDTPHHTLVFGSFSDFRLLEYLALAFGFTLSALSAKYLPHRPTSPSLAAHLARMASRCSASRR